MRFDEVELAAVPLGGEDLPVSQPVAASGHASRVARTLSLITDLSLLTALALALIPLLPDTPSLLPRIALAAFVVMISYYYFVGTWMLWGRTIGGVIFDVRVETASGSAVPLRTASLRWLGLCASFLSGGAGFLLSLLPSGASLADRMSATRSVTLSS
jgi:uncharacterized RDD family membrane protein YckC